MISSSGQKNHLLGEITEMPLFALLRTILDSIKPRHIKIVALSSAEIFMIEHGFVGCTCKYVVRCLLLDDIIQTW